MRWVILLCIAATMGACSSNKFLTEGEHLIKKNNIEIQDKGVTRSESSRLKELLANSIQPQPNSNYFFFFPKERASLRYRFEADTPRFTSWLMRLDGEVPALTDTATIAASANRLQRRLQAEGYYQAATDYRIDYKKKRANVTYDIKLGKRYKVGRHQIIVPDSTVQALIRADSSQQALGSSRAITEDLHSEERKRITNLLRNNGYYDFSSSDISKFVADTTSGRADVDLYVQYPDRDSIFTQYRIGSITIHPGFDPGGASSSARDTVVDGITFRLRGGNFIVRPKIILEKLDFAIGDLYSYKSYRQTILQLNTLDIFKTPRIAIKKRILSPGVLDYDIYLVKEKKADDHFRPELFISSFGPQELLAGVSLSGGRRIRNLLGGAETLSIDLDGSFESSFREGDNGSITTVNIGIGLQSPRYDDLGTMAILRLLPGARRILTDDYLHDLRTLGEQYIKVNLGFEDVQQFYQSTAFSVARGVQLTRGRLQTNFVFQSFDLLSPQPKSQFDAIVGDNQPFRRSFERQLTTGLLFRSFNIRYQAPVRKSTAFAISGGIEASGHEIALFNLMTDDALTSINFLGDSFSFNQFVKFEVEPKFTWYLNQKSAFAFRFGTGVILPFNNSNRTLPYNELFSLGGSYSMRGWLPRQVGPGGEDQTGVTVPFSADQFKMEFSAEFRQDLGWIVEGALFADAGNIWGLGADTDEIRRPSWRTVGVSAGLGLRFDLTFFLFRVDVAFPVRNWFPDAETGEYWNTSSLRKLISDPQVNIGINYPF